jgi:hypothetical protein
LLHQKTFNFTMIAKSSSRKILHKYLIFHVGKCYNKCD